MGCSAITKAPTLVVYNDKIKDNSVVADVFFGERYAYSCKLDNENFARDFKEHNLKSTGEAKELYEAYEDDDIKLMEMIYFEEKEKQFKKENDSL